MPELWWPAPQPPSSSLASWGRSRDRWPVPGLCPSLQHEGICTFPSMEFYQKKLKTWQGLKRPPSVLGHAAKESCCVIFGHVHGHEQSLLVPTDEGNENSKANQEEVKEVVSVRWTLLVPLGQGGHPGGGGGGVEGTGEAVEPRVGVASEPSLPAPSRSLRSASPNS